LWKVNETVIILYKVKKNRRAQRHLLMRKLDVFWGFLNLRVKKENVGGGGDRKE